MLRQPACDILWSLNHVQERKRLNSSSSSSINNKWIRSFVFPRRAFILVQDTLKGTVFVAQRSGCSVAEWLGRRIWNPVVTGSSPALTTKLELFLGRPWFNSSVMLVNSKLVCLLPVGIFIHVMFICIIWFIISLHWPWKAPLGEWSIKLFIYLFI